MTPPFPAGLIRLEVEDTGAVLHLSGEIDAAVVAAFEATDGHAAAGPVVAVDADAVTFMSSSAVALLLRRTQGHREAGGRPVLRAASPIARRVLLITGVGELFAQP